MNKQQLEELGAKLKQSFEENPVLFMGAVAAVLSGAGKLIGAYTSYRNASVWKDEVRRREAKQRERRGPNYRTQYDH